MELKKKEREKTHIRFRKGVRKMSEIGIIKLYFFRVQFGVIDFKRQQVMSNRLKSNNNNGCFSSIDVCCCARSFIEKGTEFFSLF